MNDDIERELTREEARALRALRDAPLPPSSLEERTLERLRGLGTLVPVGRRRGGPTLVAAAAAAAAIVSFGLGVAVGTLANPSVEPRYIMLLTAESDPGSTDGDERVAEYARWAKDVQEGGVGISGARLANELDVVGAPVATPGVSGYFLLDVDDEAEALAIARSCPHTRYGGSVLVGRIVR